MKIFESIIKFCVGFNVKSHSMLSGKNYVNLERRNRSRRTGSRGAEDRRSFAEQRSRNDMYLNKKAS